MITLNKAELTDIATISEMADKIWHIHYLDIISTSQIDYMLNKFYSDNAIKNSIQNGESYFLINSGGFAVGYISATNYSWGIPSPVTSYNINFDELEINERSNSSSFYVSCTGSRTGFSYGSSIYVKTVFCNIMYKKNPIETNPSIYPNPSNGKINITSFYPKSIYSIYTLEGKIIKMGNFGLDDSATIEIGNLNNGIYFISFLDINGGINSKRIVLIK